jgi:uncharacterized protein (DUF1501 family)
MQRMMSPEAAARMPRPMWFGGGRNPLPRLRPQVAFRQPGAAAVGDVLICIFQRGGMDGLAAVAPYFEGAEYYDIRPTQNLAPPGSGPGAGLDLDGRFALHPAMQGFKDLYDADSLAVIQATGLTDPTRSHFDAMRFMEQGVPGDKTIGNGWIGRHLAATAGGNSSTLRAIGISDHLQASLRGTEPALAVSSIGDIGFNGYKLPQGAADPLDVIRTLYQDTSSALLRTQAALLFDTLETLEALAAEPYTPANGAAYPDDGFGFGMRQIAQLIKAGLGMEVACLDIGGWDTHETQGTDGGAFAFLAGSLSAAITALAVDLGPLWNSTTVVTMSEFGRTAVENASRGTDHGHGNVIFVAGGGVNGGRVYTEWPGLAPEFRSDGDLAITIDWRDILAEVVTKRLLNPNLNAVFPGYSPTYRGVVRQL